MPAAMLLMFPGLEAQLLDATAMARLRGCVDLAETGALPDLDEVSDAEVVVSGWGCPPLDAGRLDRLPSLRLVAHAAGTVRGLVTDELWERGITVTSGWPGTPVSNFVPPPEKLPSADSITMTVRSVKSWWRASDACPPGLGL